MREKIIIEVSQQEAIELRKVFPNIHISHATTNGKHYATEARPLLVYLKKIRLRDGTANPFGESFEKKIGGSNNVQEGYSY